MPLLSRAGFCHCSREQESATAIASEIMPQLSRAEFRHSYRELDNATALGSKNLSQAHSYCQDRDSATVQGLCHRYCT